MKWLLVVIYLSHPHGMERVDAVFSKEAECLLWVEKSKGSPGVIKSAECIPLIDGDKL